ncbi:unnamed protein product [Arctogadus glacialis]
MLRGDSAFKPLITPSSIDLPSSPSTTEGINSQAEQLMKHLSPGCHQQTSTVWDSWETKTRPVQTTRVQTPHSPDPNRAAPHGPDPHSADHQSRTQGWATPEM